MVASHSGSLPSFNVTCVTIVIMAFPSPRNVVDPPTQALIHVPYPRTREEAEFERRLCRRNRILGGGSDKRAQRARNVGSGGRSPPPRLKRRSGGRPACATRSSACSRRGRCPCRRCRGAG